MALGTALVLVAGSFAFSGTSGATPGLVSLTGSNFEIDSDANLRLDNGTPWIDWGTIPPCSATVTTACESRNQDSLSGSGDESFGQGTKEDTPAPTVVSGGIPPNKSDLKWFGLYQEGTTLNGFLNLFWARVQDPSGTTNMDFEFNQNKCEHDSAGVETDDSDCSANNVTPLRTADDLLITYDLSKGGSHPVLSLREWVGTGTSGAWGSTVDLTASNKATGSINSSMIPVGQDDGLGALSPRTFGEAQLALSEIFDPTECKSFGSAYLKSRASDSFTAALKDFVPPESINLSNCGSAVITKTDQAGAPLNGAVFTLYRDVHPSDGATGHIAEDSIMDLNPDVEGVQGTCTVSSVTVGSVTTSTCTLSNIPLGSFWAVETTTPANYDTAADQAVVISAAGDIVRLTFIDRYQPGTISIHKQDDAGNPLNGAVFTLYSNASPLADPRDSADIGVDSDAVTTGIQATTCTTAGTGLSAGNCSFLNVPQGEYWVVETTTPTGYTTAAEQRATLTTGGQTVSLTFTDPRLFKVIVLVCQESNDTLYASNVQFDSAGTPTTNNSLGSPPAGLTNAQLCGLGGATHSGGTGAHRADVTIP